MSQIIRLMGCSSTMESGGSERQMWNLLRGIDRRSFAPHLYLLYRQGPLLAELPADVAVEDFWSRHRQPRCRWPGRIHGWQVRDLANLLRREAIDVVYERLFHMAMIAGPATRRAGVKRVANIVSPPRNDVVRSEVKFAWLKRRLLARSYRQADRLLAVSRGAAEDASAYYRIALSRFEVVWNPVDIERIERLQQEPWTGLPLEPGCFHVVAIGRLSHEKGHATLLQAAAQAVRTGELPLQLHLVGEGPLAEGLRRQAAVLDIADRVHFHGYLSNPFPLLQRMHLMVLPSRYEGLPNVLLEAMACGVPSLVTDCPGGIREATNDGRWCQLTPVDDAERMAGYLRERWQRPQPWLERLGPARQQVLEHHSYRAWLQRMQEILASTLR